MKLQIDLEREPDGQPRGVVREPGAPAALAFTGWLELASVVEAWRPQASSSPTSAHGTSTESSVGESRATT